MRVIFLAILGILLITITPFHQSIAQNINTKSLMSCGFESAESGIQNNSFSPNIESKGGACTSCYDAVCRDQYLLSVNNDWMDIQLHLIVFRNDNGNLGPSMPLIESMIDKLNADFIQAKIRFCHTITYVDDTDNLTLGHIYGNYSSYLEDDNDVINVVISAPNESKTNYFTIAGYSGLGQGIIWLNNTHVNDFAYTLTHEMGHNFGLFHVWNNTPVYLASGSPVNCLPSSDYISHPNHEGVGDFCSDTKITHRYTEKLCNFNMDNNLLDCQGSSMAVAQTNGIADPIMENYMQYGNFACKNTFTPQQIAIMRCTILNNRAGLLAYTSLGCNVTPVADFIANPQHNCVNSDIQFISKSSSNVTSYLWDFGDGNTSSLQNPIHQYQNTGYYTVSLTVSNSNGSDVMIKTDYCHIINNGYTLPYSEDFDGNNQFPPQDWYVYDPDDDAQTWRDVDLVHYYNYLNLVGYSSTSHPFEFLQVIGSDGNPTKAAYRSTNFPKTDSQYKDYLVSPFFNFNECQNSPQLKFDLAYLPTSSIPSLSDGNCNLDYSGMPAVITEGDGSPLLNLYPLHYEKRLKIYADVCGVKTLIYNKANNDLKTVNSDCALALFTPQAGDNWRNEVIDLTAYAGMDKVRFVFEISGDSISNALFIDNFEVIDNNPPIVLNVSSVDPSCNLSDGSIDINVVSGGVGPFQYSIDGGLTYSSTGLFQNLQTGTYPIKVMDASGCVVGQEVDLFGVTLSSSITVTDRTCNNADGKILIDVISNGVPPFTYTITNNINLFSQSSTNGQPSLEFHNLDIGNYEVVVTDASGCSVVNSVLLSTEQGISIDNIVVVDDFCGNAIGSIDITTLNTLTTQGTTTVELYYENSQVPMAFFPPIANSTTPYTTTFSGLNSGCYLYKIIDNTSGCYVSNTICVENVSPNNFNVVALPSLCNQNNGSIGIKPNIPTATLLQYFIQDNIDQPLLSVSSSITTIPYTNSFILSGLAPGNYRVYLSDGNNICWETQEVEILDSTYNISTSLLTQNAGGNLCSPLYNFTGTASSPGGSIVSWNWDFGDGSTSTNQNPSHQYTSGGVYEVNLTVQDANGCIGEAFPKTLNFPDGPTASFSYNNACALGQPTSFINNSSFGSAPFANYEWYFDPAYVPNSGQVPQSTIYDPQYVFPLAGSYDVTLIINDYNGCTSSITNTVTVSSGPTVSINGLSSTYCYNDPATNINGVPTGPAQPGVGVFGPGVNAEGTMFDPQEAGIGTHTITYNYLSPDGCAITYTQDVTVYPVPEVDVFGLPNSMCQNDLPIDLSPHSSTPGGIWSGAGVQYDGSTYTFDPSQTSGGNVSLTYTYTHVVNGCSGTATHNVLVNALPVVNFSSVENCENSGLSTWQQKGVDVIGDLGSQSGFSIDLSEDGNVLAVGLVRGNNPILEEFTGVVRIYDWIGSTWTQRGQDILGEIGNDNFGWSINLSSDGNSIIIGAPTNGNNGNNSGNIRVFNWNGSAWNQKGSTITGVQVSNKFGSAVAINSDATVIAAGAPKNSSNGTASGHVRIFEWTGSLWSLRGAPLVGQNAGDEFGSSLGLSDDGNTIIVGSPLSSSNGTYKGKVDVYSWNGGSWLAKGVALEGTSINDRFGWSVSIDADGNTIVAGSPISSANGTSSGKVKVYSWDGSSSWQSKGNDIIGEAAGDRSGWSVDLSNDGESLIIGATHNDGGASNSGQARAYRWDSNNWLQIANDLDGYAAIDNYGFSVAMSGDGSTIGIAAPFGDINGGNSGYTNVFQKQCVPTGIIEVCEGEVVNLMDLTTPSNEIVSWGWYNSSTTPFSTDQNPSITFNGWGDFGVYLHITDVNGCSSGLLQDVTVHPTPVASLLNLTNSLCEYDGSIDLTTSVDPMGGIWNGVGVVTNGNTYGFNPDIAGVGSHTLTYVNTGIHGCSHTLTHNITVNEAPELIPAGLNRTYCINDPKSTLWGLPVGIQYSGPGITNTSKGGSCFTPALAGGGVHVIIYSYTDPNTGCTSTGQTTVEVFDPNVSINWTHPLVFCIDDPAVSLSPYGMPGVGQPSGGVWSGTGIDQSKFQNFHPILAKAGIHTLTYTYFDPLTKCMASESIDVTVLPETDPNCNLNNTRLSNNLKGYNGHDIRVFPNPTNNNIKIDLGIKCEQVTVFVKGALGQTIFSKNYIEKEFIHVELPNDKGVYFVEVISIDKKSITKVIKQ